MWLSISASIIDFLKHSALESLLENINFGKVVPLMRLLHSRKHEISHNHFFTEVNLQQGSELSIVKELLVIFKVDALIGFDVVDYRYAFEVFCLEVFLKE